MSAQAIVQTLTLETHECGDCGIVYAAPDYFWRWRRNDGRSFSCPNGHSRHFIETEEQRLRAKLDEQTRTATAMAERARQAELAEEKATKELRRITKRAQAGVCTCCNRTFINLQRHMATKHADGRSGQPSTSGPDRKKKAAQSTRLQIEAPQ